MSNDPVCVWEWAESLSEGHDLWWCKFKDEYIAASHPESGYSGRKIHACAAGRTIDEAIQAAKRGFGIALNSSVRGPEAPSV